MRMLIVMGCFLAGCSMTLPVEGTLQNSSETFTGQATGYMDGSGNIKIISSKAASCSGNFVYVTRREGSGTLKCDDGRAGPFTFVSTGKRGTGSGTLNGQPFVFTFGNI